nr:hypothetical protein [Pandoravirus belohorizontensis]
MENRLCARERACWRRCIPSDVGPDGSVGSRPLTVGGGMGGVLGVREPGREARRQRHGVWGDLGGGAAVWTCGFFLVFVFLCAFPSRSAASDAIDVEKDQWQTGRATKE